MKCIILPAPQKARNNSLCSPLSQSVAMEGMEYTPQDGNVDKHAVLTTTTTTTKNALSELFPFRLKKTKTQKFP